MKQFINDYTRETNIATTGEFVAMGTKVLKNKNEKEYRLATVKLETNNGVKTVTVMCYEANIDAESPTGGFLIGENYLVTIAPGDERGPIAVLAPLTQGERLSVDDFTFEEINEVIEEPVA
jgi:hypothetical protein